MKCPDQVQALRNQRVRGQEPSVEVVSAAGLWASRREAEEPSRVAASSMRKWPPLLVRIVPLKTVSLVLAQLTV